MAGLLIIKIGLKITTQVTANCLARNRETGNKTSTIKPYCHPAKPAAMVASIIIKEITPALTASRICMGSRLFTAFNKGGKIKYINNARKGRAYMI